MYTVIAAAALRMSALIIVVHPQLFVIPSTMPCSSLLKVSTSLLYLMTLAAAVTASPPSAPNLFPLLLLLTLFQAKQEQRKEVQGQ